MAEESVLSLETFSHIPEDSQQYPAEFIEATGAIILAVSETDVTVGITEKTSPDVIATIRTFHSVPVTFVTIQQMELSSWLGRKFGEGSKEKITSDTKKTKSNEDTMLLDKLANDAPTVNMVNSICIDAIRSGASDIHIEAGSTHARVRYRIDGILQTVRTIESERFAAVSSRIKIMANLNILEKRLPQDGRITVTVGKETVDLRVSIIPIAYGESIVMRILGKSSAPQNLGSLGFSEDQLVKIRSMLAIPHGLILVTGPTGSGKTTTLNAMLRELVSDEIKIISIEDPVEFLVDGVDQIQINDQINLGFDTILRRVLRQDPNVIMVGEIRDKSTAELSIRAALTGHLVLSTLHTNDAVSVIPRLINMGIEPYLIASVLKGAIAQRLVRKCAEDKKSFKGRIVISETFLMDSNMENIILNGASEEELSGYLAKQGMVFLEDDAKNKINAGLTTKEEAEREIQIAEE
jgi:general secretion pathway protein E